MKKKTILAFSAVLGCVLISHQALTFTSGAPSGRSGSPISSNGNTCASSTCHSGPSVSTETISITSDIPSNGYEENQDYTITVTLSDGGTSSSKVGFEASVEGTSGHTGTITATSTETSLTGAFITHTSSGTTPSGGSKSYSFTWNSGISADATVYVAANFTNSNGSTSGDVIASESMILTKASGISLNENTIDLFEIAPNPANDLVALTDLNVDVKEVKVYNLAGSLVRTYNAENKRDATSWELNVSNFENGTYLVVPDGSSMKGAQKLIISR